MSARKQVLIPPTFQWQELSPQSLHWGQGAGTREAGECNFLVTCAQEGRMKGLGGSRGTMTSFPRGPHPLSFSFAFLSPPFSPFLVLSFILN